MIKVLEHGVKKITCPHCKAEKQFLATLDAPSTNISAPLISSKKPIINKTILVIIFHSFKN